MPRKQNNIFYIYKTTNLINNKFYIGKHCTTKIENDYLGSGKRLRYSIKKYGKENFKKEILEFCLNKNHLAEREKEIVNQDLLQNSLCMNLVIGGYGTGDYFKDKNYKEIYGDNYQKGRRTNKVITTKKQRGISNQKTSVMLVTDRYNTLDMKVATMGRISKDDLDRVIDTERLNEDNIICSDSHRSIKMYVKSLGLKHKTINVNKGEHVKEKVYHVQKVNSLTNEFKLWMRYNFRNVSTKYLQNYLYWFKMNKILKNETDGLNEFLKYALQDEHSFQRKLQIENNYQKFLQRNLQKTATNNI